ncbi:ssDNA-binding domain-containing protein [Thiotrichales bacterium 19X7-9]|nr:ssDNA-binding domain-containing protein [Thiotrichales bacterium 19X7-9]
MKITYAEYVNKIAMKIKKNIENDAGVWIDNFDQEGSNSLPINSEKKLYRGVNILNLLLSQFEKSYKTNQWLTFNQIKKLGGQVLKGEKSKEEVENGEIKVKQIICPKLYRVFNIAQTNLNSSCEININCNIEKIIEYHKPDVIHHEIGSAYYSMNHDHIRMPMPKYFSTNEDYQATLLYELSHWTLHKSRLNRNVEDNNLKSYAREELVAEISSTILLKHFSISGEVKNHEKYIESWLSLLTDNDYNIAVKESVKVISYLLNVEKNEVINA